MYIVMQPSSHPYIEYFQLEKISSFRELCILDPGLKKVYLGGGGSQGLELCLEGREPRVHSMLGSQLVPWGSYG
jgi:hypothetical protein